MAFGDHQILSSEGAQQGDPLHGVIHPLLCGLQSEVKLGFMDDVTLSGELSTVEEDVCTILQASAETGIHLNTTKCEIIMEDFTAIASSSPLADFVRVVKSEMMLLGAPETKGKPLPTRLNSSAGPSIVCHYSMLTML